MKVSREGGLLTVELHGMRAEEARQRLLSLVEHAGTDVREILVIHGYHSGQALRDMVRNELSSPRIREIRPAFQAGQTVILLK